jgi:hypothetical protein
VSLDSSTVHLHDALDSRRSCKCSEAGFSVKMATLLEDYTTEEQRPLMRFLWAKGLNAKDTNKEIFPVYGGKCFYVKRFTTGSRNSLNDVRKSQTMPDQVRKW